MRSCRICLEHRSLTDAHAHVSSGIVSFFTVAHNASRVVCSSVFWAPPFEGPLAVAPDMVDLYFDAYVAFGNAIEALSHECVSSHVLYVVRSVRTGV